MSFLKRIVGGLFDVQTLVPRLLRAAVLGAALYFGVDADALTSILGGSAGLFGAGEMNR